MSQVLVAHKTVFLSDDIFVSLQKQKQKQKNKQQQQQQNKTSVFGNHFKSA